MNLGYYFHPRCVFDQDGVAKTEAHWGYFVRALAEELGHVTFYAHPGEPSGVETLPLRSEDGVTCVDIGPRRQDPIMHLRPGPSIANFHPRAQGLDAMLVRAPTPLLPAIAKRCKKERVTMVALLVDDTSNWRSTAVYPWWRNMLIHVWLWWQRRAQDRVARSHLMLAIAPSILRRRSYRRSAIAVTTSLRKVELTGPAGRRRPFPAKHQQIRLLFTGRLFEEKGLLELEAAITLLVERGYDIHIEIAGASYGDTTIDTVMERARAHGIEGRLELVGFLEAGPELLAAYDRCDIYVLPTYGEGSVTRTIKEAFARGLPVVSTDIRENTQFLADGVHAVLVPMRDPVALADGIERVINDPTLRATITANGFDWVQDYTNEHSAALVGGHIRREIERDGYR